ncbi:uncharacterized protein C8Q71DRAFT_710648 [Rhodofomes roseus]|uniref:Uncharacterized protein n=1 Tax=Rhodofomes roseus TaxID=34475 RepID=A0ABQ8KBP5_9APHY|nr:uncharacterized protein C8Q71DRAFT_710648 [Rhodofomes roseus]KAH9834853.1 hypothetical protein C8Q71DRAFT_710648 [Rhodofomes roseus]
MCSGSPSTRPSPIHFPAVARSSPVSSGSLHVPTVHSEPAHVSAITPRVHSRSPLLLSPAASVSVSRSESPTIDVTVHSSFEEKALCQQPTTTTGEEDEEEAPALEDDPAYASREELFDDLFHGIHHSADLFYDGLACEPPAFSEAPVIRNAYIEAFISATFDHATHEAVQRSLKSHQRTIASLDRRHGQETPGLDKMALTLRTVERRLGIDPDQCIVYYFLCNVCWFRHHPSELYKLDSPDCTQDGCSGTLFTAKVMSNKKTKRIPVKIFPVTPLKQALQRILLRPGKYEEFQHWRKEGDEPGRVPPLTARGMDAFEDPSVRMQDVYDGWGWRAIQAGLKRRRGGKWDVEDVDVHEIHQRFVSLPCGLVLMFNIDCKRSHHSTGAVYVTICNNPRHKRFLREESILVSGIPGPHEPSLEQLNHILEPFVQDVKELEDGELLSNLCNRVLMKVHGKEGVHPIHGTLYIDASDLPASRKAAGLRGPTSKDFMCCYCYQSFDSLTTADAFDSETFRLRDDWRFLKYAFRARISDSEARDEIAEKRGIRWSILDALPGWMPAQNSPPEPMHANYLVQIKHTFQEILVGSGMFTARSRNDKPLTKFEDFLNSIWWPSSSGRVPQKAIKADQWRNLVHVLAVALYCAWQTDGIIPDTDAPRPKPKTNVAKALSAKERLLRLRRHAVLAARDNATAAEFDAADALEISRNYQEHYSNVLELCTALRIWGSQSISPDEVIRAHECHARACQAWAQMNCHLTPYFHLAAHNPQFYLRLGPSYAWWAYPYERNNGFLGRFKTNGHTGGELEATMMRGWIKSQLIHDLILRLDNLDHKSVEDIAVLEELRSLLKSNSRPNHQRGTLLNLVGQMVARDTGERLKLPQQSRKVKLVDLGIYGLVLRFLQHTWGDVVHLVPATAPVDAGEPFVATNIPTYSHILVDGLRYGAYTMHRGRTSCYGYIDGRCPVRIVHLLTIKHQRRDRALAPLEITCAVVQRFFADENMPVMPWSMRSTDLGIATWHVDRFAAAEIVQVTRFSGHFALAEVPYQDHKFWVTMSLCHVRCALSNPRDCDSLWLLTQLTL